MKRIDQRKPKSRKLQKALTRKKKTANPKLVDLKKDELR